MNAGAIREAQAGHRDRSVGEILKQLEIGAQGLSDSAHGWQAIYPSVRALTAADATVNGLARLVAELRMRMQADA